LSTFDEAVPLAEGKMLSGHDGARIAMTRELNAGLFQRCEK
jgi:hypothetical protein